MKNIKQPQLNQEATEAFQHLGAVCVEVAETLGKWVRAAADAMAAVWSPALQEYVKIQGALYEAPPRLKHLAIHNKKFRTRKKNLHRIIRDYENRRKRDEKEPGCPLCDD